MKEELKYLYNNTNDWLKYAETKNAGLGAFNIAALAGLYQTKTESSALLLLSIALIILSIILNIYSIMPVLKGYLKFFRKLNNDEFNKVKNSISIYYFSDLVKINASQLIELINFKTKLDIKDDKVLNDLAKQIINNSEIAQQKFKIFRISGFLTMGSLLIIVVNIILNNCA